MTVIPVRPTVKGTPVRREASFSLRINLFSQGNLPNSAKKPDTESTLAQGPPEYPNPSGTALKPPEELEHALLPVSLLGKSWAQGRLFLLKVIKSVKTGVTRKGDS